MPDPAQNAITGGDSWFGTGLASFQIFSTYVRSEFDQTIMLNVTGDDGHSLFVDDVFVGGGAFAAAVGTDLTLQAGVSRKIVLAGYSGPANWAFSIGKPLSRPLPNDNPQYMTPIASIPGIMISADDSFVPEPRTAWLLTSATCMLVFSRRKPGYRL